MWVWMELSPSGGTSVFTVCVSLKMSVWCVQGVVCAACGVCNVWCVQRVVCVRICCTEPWT